MTQKPTCIDLFAGAGGFSLGFQKAGYDIKGNLDILMWNKKLSIQMNKKKAAEQVDKAINLIIGEAIMGAMKKRVTSK